MEAADGRIASVGTFDRRDGDRRLLFVEERHMNRAGFAPEAEQRRASVGKARGERLPQGVVDNDARPWLAPPDPSSLSDRLGESRHEATLPRSSLPPFGGGLGREVALTLVCHSRASGNPENRRALGLAQPGF